MLVVLSSPSGGGKTVTTKLLLKKHPEFARSISVTTRKKRRREKNGRDYYFVNQKEFRSKIKKGEFIEWAKVFGDYYGTAIENIRKAEGKKEVLILTLDVQGALSVKRKYPQSVLIFILPPSLRELKKRLVRRNTDRPETIKMRLKFSLKEIGFCKKYDYVMVNDSLKGIVGLIEKIIIAEKHKTERTVDFLLKRLS